MYLSKKLKNRISLTLKEQLGLCFGVTICTLAIILSWVVGERAKNEVMESDWLMLEQLSDSLVYSFDRGMFERYIEIDNIASLDEFRDSSLDLNYRRSVLERLQDNYPNYVWIAFAGVDGQVQVATEGLLEGESVLDRPWFDKALLSPYVGSVREANILAQVLPPLPDGKPLNVLDVAYPVYDEDGEVLGILIAYVNWNWIQEVKEALLANIPEDQEVEFLITNGNGLILFDSGGQEEGKNINYLLNDLQQSPTGSEIRPFNGEDYLMVYTQDQGFLSYPGLDFHIIVKQPEMIAFQAANELRNGVLGWGFGAAVVFSAVGWAIAHYFTKPLLKIADQANQIEQGDRTLAIFKEKQYQTLEKNPRNEIKLLSSSLAKVLKTLINQENNLKKINQELENKIQARTEELKSAKEIAESANRAKSIFLSNMSHELRTPLNAILGFSQLMQDDPHLTPEYREDLNIIVHSGEHLLSLINEVLELSKIEAGQITFNKTAFKLEDLLYSLKSMLQIKATEKNIQLIFDIDPHIPNLIITDERKLRQILLNLISNSLKFTQEGSVSIAARQGEDNKLIFSVIDTGFGMTQEELEKLFTPFFQSESGIKSKEGTGLGLTISRQFVNLMGGSIQAESEKYKGTKFTFSIKFTPLEDATDDNQINSNQKRIIGLAHGTPEYRILIVDDQKENRVLLHKLLEPLGFKTNQANNGQMAVEIAQQWQPHLILMDIGMPVMDGYQATKLIRQNHSHIKPIIIAVTAHAFMEEKTVILESGCDDVISKPFVTRFLLDKLRHFLHLEYIYQDDPLKDTVDNTMSSSLATNRNLTILVAEDNRVNQKLIVNLLGKLGYEIDVANNGVEVLEKLTAQKYDVIFMDVEMPEMDGVTATKKIREIYPPSQQPIIVAMTAHDDNDSREMFENIGMKYYLPKPIKLPELKSILMSVSEKQ
ncbi:integral membrane sensor hybrid histidine kinase [Cyanobacterium stanieri PCC 7202]|uniref:Circadian input-output histidine kinase CikA n=1 Tax=Cyanobacterium stanieri (strain ATCC 29140 / PCC 7202) TaxID=292563 RepID=K9YNN8_CYASC|nr:integral membrane sensor hybrid histidine kinase [Cyanobacterium stanieri PCC 7202]